MKPLKRSLFWLLMPLLWTCVDHAQPCIDVTGCKTGWVLTKRTVNGQPGPPPPAGCTREERLTFGNFSFTDVLTEKCGDKTTASSRSGVWVCENGKTTLTYADESTKTVKELTAGKLVLTYTVGKDAYEDTYECK